MPKTENVLNQILTGSSKTMVELYKNNFDEYICLLGVSCIFEHFDCTKILDICFCNTRETEDMKKYVLFSNIVNFICLRVDNPTDYFNHLVKEPMFLSISTAYFEAYNVVRYQFTEKEKELCGAHNSLLNPYRVVTDKFTREEKELWVTKNRLLNKEFNEQCSKIKPLDEYIKQGKKELAKYNNFFEFDRKLKKYSTLKTKRKEKLKKYYVYVKEFNYYIYMGGNSFIYLGKQFYINMLWDYKEKVQDLYVCEDLDDFYATGIACNFIKELR